MRNSKRGQSGFMMLDVAIAIAILVVLTMGMATVVHQQSRALHDLRMSDEARVIAERVLAELQANGKLSEPAASEARITIEPVEGAEAPAGYVWVQVTVGLEKVSAELVGVAPADAMEGLK